MGNVDDKDRNINVKIIKTQEDLKDLPENLRVQFEQAQPIMKVLLEFLMNFDFNVSLSVLISLLGIFYSTTALSIEDLRKVLTDVDEKIVDNILSIRKSKQ